MPTDCNQYREVFIEEAREHIDTLTQSLLSLEKDPQNIELVNVLFRAAHTLKGCSGMMGYKDMQELTHAMEDVFDDLRKGLKPSSNLISVLLECADALSSRLENIQNMNEEEIKVPILLQRLQEATELTTIEEVKEIKQEVSPVEIKKEVLPVETTTVFIELTETEKEAIINAEVCGEHCYFVDLKFSKDCAFKSVRAILVLSKISELAEVIKTHPDQKALEAFKEDELDAGFKLAIISKCSAEEIEKCIRQVCEIEDVHVAHYNPVLPEKETKPEIKTETLVPFKTENQIEAKQALNTFCVALEQNVEGTNQVSLVETSTVTSAKTENAPLSDNASSLRRCIDEQSKQITEATKLFAEVRATQTVRVKFEQLDKIMNLVGELVINKIALLQLISDNRSNELKRIAENIDRLTSDLHDLVMQVRMVPVSQIFDRFPRLVRDLSLKRKKLIELVMEGRDIEIDRTVLDEIGEPLIHLLRNSIDHGIEPPEERKKLNKDPVGKIRLAAQRSGEHVIIEVEDDGAGIDPEKIKAVAIQKGFISKEEAEKMSRNELVGLIFLPGFSTNKEVTETSGRGVGMDVVKTKIAALGGTVQFETRVGKGTKIILKVPLTLAIIKAILVRDSGQTFTIPTSQVSEIIRAKKSDIKLLGKTDAIVVRGKVIPVVHLHKLLGYEGPEEEEFELLITHLGDEKTKIGLIVDSVISQQDILVKPLSETLKGIKGISGATILGDGQVVLVLDVGQFVNTARKNA
ncbi:MAG: chemotaxis protein CheA [Candidatus Bathyarchaeota archaeon]|nr:chemotaxis protein CheA [Candidatus Bathyarchaeota archaeon]